MSILDFNEEEKAHLASMLMEKKVFHRSSTRRTHSYAVICKNAEAGKKLLRVS